MPPARYAAAPFERVRYDAARTFCRCAAAVTQLLCLMPRFAADILMPPLFADARADIDADVMPIRCLVDDAP